MEDTAELSLRLGGREGETGQVESGGWSWLERGEPPKVGRVGRGVAQNKTDGWRSKWSVAVVWHTLPLIETCQTVANGGFLPLA